MDGLYYTDFTPHPTFAKSLSALSYGIPLPQGAKDYSSWHIVTFWVK